MRKILFVLNLLCAVVISQAQCYTSLSNTYGGGIPFNKEDPTYSGFYFDKQVSIPFKPNCTGQLSAVSFYYYLAKSDLPSYQSGVSFDYSALQNFYIDIYFYDQLNVIIDSLKKINLPIGPKFPDMGSPSSDLCNPLAITIMIPEDKKINLLSTKNYGFVVRANSETMEALNKQKVYSQIYSTIFPEGTLVYPFSFRLFCIVKDEIYNPPHYYPYSVKINSPLQPIISTQNYVCKGSEISLSTANTNGAFAVEGNSNNIVNVTNQTTTSITLKGLQTGSVVVKYIVGTDAVFKTINVKELATPTITPNKSDINNCFNPNDLVLTGNTTTNNTLNLTGNNYATAPNCLALGLTNAFTLEAQVYIANPALPQYIISKGTNDRQSGHYGLLLLNNKIQFVAQAYPSATVTSAKPITTSQWVHIAATYDGAKMRLFVNGIQTDSLPVVFSLIPNSDDLQIGQMGLLSNPVLFSGDLQALYRFIGQIDEVRIWNVCRPIDSIAKYQKQTVPANNTGLVAYYKFNEPSGNNLIDASGTNNNATLVCTATYANCGVARLASSLVFSDYNYKWSNNATTPTITPNSSATYNYSITDIATGCSAQSADVAVKINTVNSIELPTICSYPYTWNNNAINPTESLTFNANDGAVTKTTPLKLSANGTCSTYYQVKALAPFRLQDEGGTVVTAKTIKLSDTNKKLINYSVQAANNAQITWATSDASKVDIAQEPNPSCAGCFYDNRFRSLKPKAVTATPIVITCTYSGCTPALTSTVNVTVTN